MMERKFNGYLIHAVVSSTRQLDLDPVQRFAVGARDDFRAAVVALGDLAHERQSEAAALRSAAHMSPLKRFESARDIGW